MLLVRVSLRHKWRTVEINRQAYTAIRGFYLMLENYAGKLCWKTMLEKHAGKPYPHSVGRKQITGLLPRPLTKTFEK
ncbi:MAG: hypothetical protein F6K55_48520 [Moorea sp. SIO4A3]|nr:hypothetical protein [Moorena sp. SIO4A3]NEQ80170.1 hypothetical protein [Moorena sp. SIO2I5]